MAYPERGSRRRSHRRHRRARPCPQGPTRQSPLPAGPKWLRRLPVERRLPSGHSAGSLAWSLAFLSVVPISWRWPTAIAGVVTPYISLGVLVLNYHYPSDVLRGWLLAAGWGLALPRLQPTTRY